MAAMAAACFEYDRTQTLNAHAVPGLTYFGPDGYGTAPAVINMWTQYYHGSSPSQADIWDALSESGASNGDGGTSPWLFQDATQALSGTYTYFATYDYGSDCNGGKSCRSQAIADIIKAVEANKPPAVIMLSDKYAMISARGTSRKCNSLRTP